MRIATNTPSSFYSNTHDYIRLGTNVVGSDIIVLMLPKNWGSGSIDQIKAITHWVSQYDRQVPCYLVGCESTIPDLEIERYRHKERDDAVRELCLEVLRRSDVIGVRGEITFKYLTEMLGFDRRNVEIIYDKTEDSDKRLASFLERTRCPDEIKHFAFWFQKRPEVLYERPIGYDKTIWVSELYITESEGKARVNADIKIDGHTQTLWCETASEYRHFLLFERSDAFLSALLPFAMRSEKDIHFQTPITEQFLHNVEEVLVPQLCAHDSRLYASRIFASPSSGALSQGMAVATGMSSGVDSFYTASMYLDSKYRSMNLTHLYCGNYLYGNENKIFERAEKVSSELGLRFVSTSTNLNEALKLPHLFTHFFKMMFGVLSLRKLFKAYYYSTAHDFSYFDIKKNSTSDTAKFELLLLYVFTAGDFNLLTGGAKSERLEKTRGISDMPAAQRHLNVCLYPLNDVNCGKCGKCRRTLLMLDYLGKLDEFDQVFNIPEYRRERSESFIYLASQKDTPIMSEVYRCFEASEPVLIAQANQVVEAAKKGDKAAQIRVRKAASP